ncbi:PEGA domain-containing protein [Planctomycetota bacterium]
MRAAAALLAVGSLFASQFLAAGQPPTRLYVRTLPPKAQVFLDGKGIGKSDGLFVVEPGAHTVRVQLGGYRPEERRIDVTAGQIARVVLPLQKHTEPNPEPARVAFRPGDVVKVTSGPAPVKAGERTLATVDAGAELAALQVKDGWVMVAVEKAGEKITGWVHAKRLSVLARTQRYRILIASQMDATHGDGQTRRTGSETTFDFTRELRGQAMQVRCDGTVVVVKDRDTEISRTSANRERISIGSAGGDETVFTPTDRDPQVQRLFRNCFEASLLTVSYDSAGNETSRKISISQDAVGFPLGGAAVDCMLLFHSPCFMDRLGWSAPTEIDMGGGLGKVRGNLNFTRLGGAVGGLRKVRVTGTLSLNHSEVPKFGIVVNNARYEVDGELTYDHSAGGWTAGGLNMTLSWKSEVAGKPQTHQGTMRVSFERLPSAGGGNSGTQATRRRGGSDAH